MTVPIATAALNPQPSHSITRRQSRGPCRVACTVFHPPAMTPIIALLNTNFRMSTSGIRLPGTGPTADKLATDFCWEEPVS